VGIISSRRWTMYLYTVLRFKQQSAWLPAPRGAPATA
jgi:hypothetical protein